MWLPAPNIKRAKPTVANNFRLGSATGIFLSPLSPKMAPIKSSPTATGRPHLLGTLRSGPTNPATINHPSNSMLTPARLVFLGLQGTQILNGAGVAFSFGTFILAITLPGDGWQYCAIPKSLVTDKKTKASSIVNPH